MNAINPKYVAVLGAGTMGRGIAQLIAQNNMHVVLYDISNKACEDAITHHKNIFKRLVEKGKITSQQSHSSLNNIAYTSQLQDIEKCDFVIEAIVEKTDIKQDVLQKVENIVSPNTIIATNTSSLSIASLSHVLLNKKRFVGLHFFNPAPLIALVELIPHIGTEKEILQPLHNLLKTWGKIPIIAKDTPGFIVNRVARPFYSEPLRILEEGIANIYTIDWAMKHYGNFRMGPFKLMDLIGNDINYTVTESVFSALYYDQKYTPSIIQKRMVEAGLLGRKTQRGFYDYNHSKNHIEHNIDKKLGKDVFNRIIAVLINHAASIITWQVANIKDIDYAVTKGLNYPKGLLQWGDELGLDWVLNIMQKLFNKYGELRYYPASLIVEKVAQNKKFYE